MQRACHKAQETANCSNGAFSLPHLSVSGNVAAGKGSGTSSSEWRHSGADCVISISSDSTCPLASAASCTDDERVRSLTSGSWKRLFANHAWRDTAHLGPTKERRGQGGAGEARGGWRACVVHEERVAMRRQSGQRVAFE